MRERDRERQRQRQRDRDKDRERQRDRQIETETERQTETDRQTDTKRDTQERVALGDVGFDWVFQALLYIIITDRERQRQTHRLKWEGGGGRKGERERIIKG